MNSPDTYRKHRPDAPAGFFAAEAAGLAWLADAAAVPVVGVRSVGPDAIELERLHTVATGATASTTFGRQLCDLHDARAPHFGAPPPGAPAHGYIGDAPLSYAPAGRHARWGSFYAAERVLPYARTALARGDLTTSGLALIARLCERLDAGDFDDDAPPARLHGDLWSGNVLFTASGVTLIDPAAHGGHRITDLAMLALFGAPHLSAILDAYAATSQHLPDDWRRLVGLHQVHPLLVHAVLFGGGYGQRAVAAARPFVGKVRP